jgi:hypothetical protein
MQLPEKPCNQRTTSTPRRALGVMLVLGILLSSPLVSMAAIQDVAYDKTLALFTRLPGMDQSRRQEDEQLLRTLSYTRMRAFRAFCRLPGMTGTEAAAILRQLPSRRIQFEHVPLLERLSRIDDATAASCWRLIARLDAVDYVSSRTLAGLANVREMSTADFFRLIDRVEPLDEPGRWAAGALFAVEGITAAEVGRGLTLIDMMRERQRWAAEHQCRIKGISAGEALDGMAGLPALSESDAWNARSLFMLPEMTPGLAASWLKGYFSVPAEQREHAFLRLSAHDKGLLLKVFAAASDYPLWQINNLHDITDSFGHEIGAGTLAGYTDSGLLTLFQRLHPAVRQAFAGEMQRALNAGNRGAAIAVLRRATAAARKQTAVDLTSANIYVLLAHGGDLYDSSFRDILVPVLKARIVAASGDDLLAFLVATDPVGQLTADFIASLAQKGKLTFFFPRETAKQQQVLDLVARSALQNEFSLILFSAAFSRLLEPLEPAARSYLLSRLLDAAHSENNLFSRQVRIILQYYLDAYPALLAAGDKARIREMLGRLGPIDLSPYNRTPFAQWKSDGQLQSLSVFQRDDDGRSSYLSYSRTLLDKGYRPELSTTYRLSGLSPATAASARSLAAAVGNRGDGLARILQLSAAQPLVIDWTRTVNGLRLSHSLAVYQGKTAQQQLLGQFLKSGGEMFAQRGHSYWRREQLIDPLRDLLAAGSITPVDLRAKQRFLSIGSCGGIRAYSELNRMFGNNVDILATIGTGKTSINNPYNQQFLEIIARHPADLTWEEVAGKSAEIFRRNLGEDYLQPGSLPAILHKIMDLKPESDGTDKTR